MEKRKCKECKHPFPLTDFANAGTINGIRYFRHKCKKCYLKFKNNRRSRITKQVLEYKKKLKCNRCGFDDHRTLHFHHKDDNKEHTIANMGGFAFENILKEIAKCEVLCANCHAIEHFGH